MNSGQCLLSPNGGFSCICKNKFRFSDIKYLRNLILIVKFQGPPGFTGQRCESCSG